MKNIDEIKYFEVTVKCGHVGHRNYIPIVFAIRARSRKEASEVAREIPRVKHNRKDAIISSVEITFDEFIELMKINNIDLYLKAQSIQEQRRIEGIEDRIVRGEREEKFEKQDRKNETKKLIKRNAEILDSYKEEMFMYC